MNSFTKLSVIMVITIINPLIVISQSYKREKIDSVMRAAHGIGVFNGNVLVIRGGETFYSAELGYSDASRTKMLTSEHRFAIGSISKEFNSVGIMILKEKGKLKLSDSISKFLPQLPDWADKIQIRHLLQYTSGLPKSITGADSNYFKVLMNLEKLEFEPGSAFNYSNVDVFIRKRIIEQVSKMPYNDFIKKFLFAPAGMSCVIIDTTSVNANIAQSFDNNFNEKTYSSGGNSMYLTINDLYKWIKALHSYAIVSKNSLMELAESFDGNEGSLGQAKFENENFIQHGHLGSGNYYEALLYSNLEADLTIILMTNNQNFKVTQLKEAIVNIVTDRPYKIPRQSVYLAIREKIYSDFDQGIALYNQIKSTQKEKYDFDNEVSDLYSTGIYLMNKNRFDDAIRIFQIGSLLDLNNHGGLSYAFTLIGRCYLKSGSNDMALIYYNKALELDANNKTAAGMLMEILSEK